MMNFGDNLQFYRKKNNITQEQLAEKLSVSRQSISKWESNTTYPEMDKLLQICDLFACTLDTLLRGDAESACNEDTVDYDRHTNGFSRAITVGLFLMLLGVVALLTMIGFGLNDTFGVLVLLALIIAGLMTMITAGLGHDSFTKKHPNIKPFYEAKVIEKAEKRFNIAMPAAVGGLLLGVLWMVGSSLLPLLPGTNRNLYVAAFILIESIAIAVMVYAGMQKDKYDIHKYNRQNDPKVKAKADDPLVGKWCGSIMMLAIASYLTMGLAAGWWATAWVVFPIAILLCGMASLIISKTEKQGDQ